MTFSPIASGTEDWDVPLNAALTDLQNQVTSLSTAVTALQGARVFARKTVDETVTNSTAYQSDDELFVSTEAGSIYVVEGFIAYNTPTAAGLNIRLTGPTGTGLWGINSLSVSGGTTDTGTVRLVAMTNGMGSARLGGTGGDITATIRGTFLPTASGTLGLHWAQNTASASPTVVRANSWLSVQKIA